MKKILSLILSLLMIVSAMPLSVFAAERITVTPVEEFDMYKYIADMLADNYKGTAFDDTPVARKQLLCLSDPTTMSPAQILLDAIKTNTEFVNRIAAWEIATFDPAKFMEDQMLDEQGYYEMILLSMVDSLFESDSYIDVANSEEIKLSLKIGKSISKELKKTYNIEYETISKQSFTQLLPDLKQTLMDTTENELKKWEGRSEIIGGVAKIFETADTIESYIERTASIGQLVKCQEDVKAVLKEMYDNCPRSEHAMRAALGEVNMACSSEFDNFTVNLINGVVTVGNQAFKDFTKLMWENVLASIGATGAGWLLITYAVTVGLCNVLFSTDEIVEQCYKLEALCKLEDLLYDSVWTLEEKYKDNETSKNAKAYLKSIELLFEIRKIGCDYTKEYADLVYTGGIIEYIPWLKGDTAYYEGFVKSVTNLRSAFESDQKMFLDIDNYIYYLEVDYPEVYELYCSYDSVVLPDPNPERIYFGTTDEGNNYYLYYKTDDRNEITITRYEGIHGGTIRLPDTIDGCEIRYIGDEAFKDCTGITNIVLPGHLQTIGERAFSNCTALRTITLPSTFTTAYDYAFEGCNALETVYYNNTQERWDDITELLKSDGNECLYNAELITLVFDLLYKLNYNKKSVTITGFTGPAENVNIPSRIDGYDVVAIGDGAFKNCNTITSLSIPASITEIGDEFINYCGSLETITVDAQNTNYHSSGNCLIETKTGKIIGGCNNSVIPDDGSVTSIGNNAFSGCTSLTRITIPDSVTSIGHDAFYDCDSLTSINIPDSVTSIGKNAFWGCDSLNAVYITDLASWCEIDFRAYYDYGSGGYSYFANPLYYANNLYLNGELVTELVIPDSVTRIGGRAFLGCTSLTSVDLSGCTALASIGSDAFSGCDSLTSVELSGCTALTSIGGDAFSDCDSLTSVELSGCTALTSIGDGAFYCCDSLTSFELSDCTALASIGIEAFYGCDSLTSITIPDSVTYVGTCAFESCDNLEAVVLPAGIEKINEWAFAWCRSLVNVTIPSGVKNISSSAFFECNNLKNVYIEDVAAWCSISFNSDPAKVSPLSSADNLYLNGVLLKDLVIPEGVTSISAGAFCNFDNLKSAKIPEGVTSIGANAFFGCSGLEYVYIPDSVTSIGYQAFIYCSSLEEIRLPEGISSIESYTFFNSGLTSIKIPEGVKSIGYDAFYACVDLTSIVLPKSIEEIDSKAFDMCNSLSDVWYSGDERFWGTINIGNGNNLLTEATIHYETTFVGISEGDCVSGTYEIYQCSDGHQLKKEIEPALGHGETVDTYLAPTCAENGYNRKTCLACGEYVVDEIIPATGEHIPGDVEMTEATCSSEGKKITRCSVCDEILFEESLPVKEHSPVTEIIESTCSSGGRKTTKCSVCDTVISVEYLPYGDHVLETQIEESTCWYEGYKYSWCTLCAFAFEEKLPLADHKLSDDGRCTVCGMEFGAAGTCGDDLQWQLNKQTGELSITGEGDMYDYYMSDIPWYNDAKSITSVYIEDGVTSLCSYAFYNCINLVEVTLPESITSLPMCVFRYCRSLENIELPQGLTNIGLLAFSDCSALLEINIPESVTEIGGSAFNYCSSLRSITVPSKVTKINSGMFSNCSALERAQLSNDVTVIGNEAFFECSSLRDINLPNKLTILGSRAFAGCTSLKKVTVPVGIKLIEQFAFSGCSALETVELSAAVRGIGMGAFGGCTSLKTVQYDGSEEDWANVVIYKTNGDNVFESAKIICLGISDPSEYPETEADKLLGLAYYESYDGEYLIINGYSGYQKNLEIPSEINGKPVGLIYDWAFSGCDILESVVIPNSVHTVYGGAFNRCNNLKNVVLSENMSSVTYNMFYECPSLESITIPENITSIGGNAFDGCSSLKSVVIPKSVDYIGFEAFNRCTSLETVYYAGTEEQWNEIVIISNGNEYVRNANIIYNWEGSDDTPALNGWTYENSKWAYYENGVKLANQWKKDSTGWCYLGSDGYMVTNAWLKDSKGWCYVGADGYCATNCWKKDSYGWIWLDSEGSMTKSKWILDGGKWYYLDENGYMVSNQWRKDSKGWCWLTASGAMATNQWVKDSKGWCYIEADGYCATNCWKKDSIGWIWLDSEGSMTKNKWILDGGKWYYLDSNGYMVTGKKLIGGTYYTFNSSGVWVG